MSIVEEVAGMVERLNQQAQAIAARDAEIEALKLTHQRFAKVLQGLGASLDRVNDACCDLEEIAGIRKPDDAEGQGGSTDGHPAFAASVAAGHTVYGPTIAVPAGEPEPQPSVPALPYVVHQPARTESPGPLAPDEPLPAPKAPTAKSEPVYSVGHSAPVDFIPVAATQAAHPSAAGRTLDMFCPGDALRFAVNVLGLTAARAEEIWQSTATDAQAPQLHREAEFRSACALEAERARASGSEAAAKPVEIEAKHNGAPPAGPVQPGTPRTRNEGEKMCPEDFEAGPGAIKHGQSLGLSAEQVRALVPAFVAEARASGATAVRWGVPFSAYVTKRAAEIVKARAGEAR